LLNYNIIVKGGNLAKIQILNVGNGYLLKGSEIVTVFSMNDFVLNLDNRDEKRNIDGFSLFGLQIDDDEKISITSSNSPVIITEFVIK